MSKHVPDFISLLFKYFILKTLVVLRLNYCYVLCSQCFIFTHNPSVNYVPFSMPELWRFILFPVLHLTNINLLQQSSSNTNHNLIVTSSDSTIPNFHFNLVIHTESCSHLNFYYPTSKFPPSLCGWNNAIYSVPGASYLYAIRSLVSRYLRPYQCFILTSFISSIIYPPTSILLWLLLFWTVVFHI